MESRAKFLGHPVHQMLVPIPAGLFIVGAILDIVDRFVDAAWIPTVSFWNIVLGIFALTTTGGAGATLYMLNHGFATAALFLIGAMLVARRGSKRIPDFGGWQRVTPGLAGVFLVAGLSGLALPGLASFLSEFLVLVGTFQRYQVAAVIATVGIILAALYILLMYKRMMTGPKPELADPVHDWNLREKLVVAPLIVAFVFLGLMLASNGGGYVGV